MAGTLVRAERVQVEYGPESAMECYRSCSGSCSVLGCTGRVVVGLTSHFPAVRSGIEQTLKGAWHKCSGTMLSGVWSPLCVSVH